MSWKKLKKNSEIHFVAPSSGGIDKKSIDKLKGEVKSRGFEPVIIDDLLNETLFCSNTDEFRFKHLSSLLADDNVSAIWAIRGGYGAARIIPKLYDIPKPKEEKIFIGYSDITALHLFLSQEWGWKTIHAPVGMDLINKNKDKNSLKILEDLITKKNFQVSIPVLTKLNSINSNNIKAKITGGNMCIVETSIGTRWQIDASNKILFLEDWKEEAYKVDRMLEHMMQAGVFDDVKAVVFGEVTNSNGESSDISVALMRFAEQADFPVFIADSFGHGNKNYPIVYNAEAEISQCDGGFMLSYTE